MAKIIFVSDLDDANNLVTQTDFFLDGFDKKTDRNYEKLGEGTDDYSLKNSVIVSFRHTAKDVLITAAIDLNPDALIVLFGVSANKSQVLSEHLKSKSRPLSSIWINEPYTCQSGPKSRVEQAIKSGVPASNVYSGGTDCTGSNISGASKLSDRPGHFQSLTPFGSLLAANLLAKQNTPEPSVQPTQLPSVKKGPNDVILPSSDDPGGKDFASTPDPKDFNPSKKKWNRAKVGEYFIETISTSPPKLKVSGNYDTSKAPYGGGGDALHSFESRKKDRFGGRMTSIIQEQLLYFYQNGINPFIENITISVSGAVVSWEASIVESKDGKAYVNMTSRGAAGGNADRDQRSKENLEKKKKELPGEKNEPNMEFKEILDYENDSGGFRQIFVQFTQPKANPPKAPGGKLPPDPNNPSSNVESPKSDPKQLSPKLTLVKKSGPGELLGETEIETINGLAVFKGLQFDEPGVYVITVMSSDPQVEEEDFTIVVSGNPLPESSDKPVEPEVTGTRPIITNIDPPSIKLDPITIPIPITESDQNIKDTAQSIGLTPFIWLNGVGIDQRYIKKFELFHNGIVPQVEALIEDSTGVLSRDGFPLDDSYFQIFLNSSSKYLKSIHLKLKLIKFSETKNKTYTLSGKLDLKDFYKIKFDSYRGTSFGVLRELSKELEIGFNSNIVETQDEMKWKNVGKNYENFISHIIKHSYINDQSFMMGYIDFYYCLNFVDVEKEWNRDNNSDVGIETSTLAGLSGATSEEDTISKIILSNDVSDQGSVNYISKVLSVKNNSTDLSTKFGQFTQTKFYDTAKKSFLIFDVDSLSEDNGSKMILKGKPADGKELKENFRTFFGGRFDFSNVHENYVYAETQNKRNMQNLARISCQLELKNINYNLYKYQKVKIIFSNKVQTGSDPDLVQSRISGDWIITDIRYSWNGTSLKQILSCARKDLEKLKEEKEGQQPVVEEEKKGENKNEEVEADPPNSVYEVGEVYRLRNKDGSIEYELTIEKLLDNGIEVQGYLIEIPIPEPEPPPPPEPPPTPAPEQTPTEENNQVNQESTPYSGGPLKLLEGNFSTAKDNNPFNLRPLGGKDQFNGTIGKKFDKGKDGKGNGYFTVFDTRANGIRAGMKNLSNYFVKYKRDSVEAVLAAYCPGASTGYKNYVVNTLKNGDSSAGRNIKGWNKSASLTGKLPLFKGKDETSAENIRMFKTLVSAMHVFEGGSEDDLKDIENYPIKNL